MTKITTELEFKKCAHLKSKRRRWHHTERRRDGEQRYSEMNLVPLPVLLFTTCQASSNVFRSRLQQCMRNCLHRNWRADEWQVEEAEEVLVLVIEWLLVLVMPIVVELLPSPTLSRVRVPLARWVLLLDAAHSSWTLAMTTPLRVAVVGF